MIGTAVQAMGIKYNYKPHVFMLSESYMPFVFTVPPTDYTVSSQQSHNSINIIDFGEKVLDGAQGALRISWSGIFLHPRHSWLPSIEGATGFIPPKVCEMRIREYMNSNEKFKLFVPEWLEYVKCKIESFEITHRDHTGDIYYRISFVEEREGLSSTAEIMNKIDGYVDKVKSKLFSGSTALTETELLKREAEMLKITDTATSGKEIISSGDGLVNGLRERAGAIPIDTKSSVA